MSDFPATRTRAEAHIAAALRAILGDPQASVNILLYAKTALALIAETTAPSGWQPTELAVTALREIEQIGRRVGVWKDAAQAMWQIATTALARIREIEKTAPPSGWQPIDDVAREAGEAGYVWTCLAGAQFPFLAVYEDDNWWTLNARYEMAYYPIDPRSLYRPTHWQRFENFTALPKPLPEPPEPAS